MYWFIVSINGIPRYLLSALHGTEHVAVNIIQASQVVGEASYLLLNFFGIISGAHHYGRSFSQFTIKLVQALQVVVAFLQFQLIDGVQGRQVLCQHLDLVVEGFSAFRSGIKGTNRRGSIYISVLYAGQGLRYFFGFLSIITGSSHYV